MSLLLNDASKGPGGSAPPAVIVYGATDFRLEPDKITERHYGMDQVVAVWQTGSRDTFRATGEIPGHQCVYINEDEITEEIPGVAYIHRLQGSGIAGPSPWKEENAPTVEEPDEGWDTAQRVLLTTSPESHALKDAHPQYPGLYVTSRAPEPVRGRLWRVRLGYKGRIGNKVRKRRITVNSQVVSSSGTLALVGNTFVNESGVYTGWPEQRRTALDTSSVVVVETVLSTTPPPTDKLPGHMTPVDAPAVKDLFALSWWNANGFTFAWPHGWKLAGIQSEQLFDLSLWMTTLTMQYEPRARPNV